ncbi:MAG: ABC transporter ATP-binding protein [Oscillospiraceae bacterium]|nr:ABC transporter ATP-binding protein [Oscillospiraceae bacterium]
MAQIICRSLTLGYESTKVAENISFSVQRGDYLCIIGENGSGKSTLVKALLGLNPPISGEIEFGDDLRKNEIGYLPQQTQAQRDFPASVEEIVLSGCVNRKGLRPFYSAKERAAADEAMKRLDVLSLKKRCYRELSGGQQQRVLLSRALCATDKLILLDEPVTGLDPKAAEEMYSLIKKLNESGTTVIMVSHDMSAALKYSSHILRMGMESVFFGTTSEYMNSPHYLNRGDLE